MSINYNKNRNLKNKKPSFANISVKLISKDGSIQSTTECMPNGYYFIPIYENVFIYYNRENIL